MKPLSIFTYYLNNKRKVLPVILVIALSVLAVTVTAALTGALARDVRNDLNFYNKYFTVSAVPAVVGNSKMNSLENAINALMDQDDVIKANVTSIRVTAMFGAGAKSLFFLNSSDYEPFLKEVDWQLIDGILPKAGTNEVALSERLMKNRSLVLGDKVGKEVDETDFLNGEYIVVGILKETNIIGGIGSFEYINRDSSAPPALTYLINPKSGKEQELVNALNDIKKDFAGIAITEPVALGKDLDSQFASIDAMVLAVNIILVIVVSISVALLNVIFFMQRANEFGLLAAIGYSKLFIIRKTLLEILGIVSFAWILGICFAQSIYTYLNETLYYPKGMEALNVFETRTLLYSLPVPVAVVIFGVAIVLWTLVKMDPISIIEKRD